MSVGLLVLAVVFGCVNFVCAGPVDYVDPLIGTESKRADAANAAGMQPFVGVPFGMWQWTAMTQLSNSGRSAMTIRANIIDADEDVKKIFYTGMYQALQFPREFGEYGRYYLAFDGKPVTDWKIRHADIIKGGELVFEMEDKE